MDLILSVPGKLVQEEAPCAKNVKVCVLLYTFGSKSWGADETFSRIGVYEDLTCVTRRKEL
jgi:hypothetical protein